MEDHPTTILDTISSPDDLAGLDESQLTQLATEIREFVVDTVNARGSGHLGSNLGVVELTIALHRVFHSPHDIIVWDTGHQAYVHKLLTGRQADFDRLREEGGLSGYPSRTESDHDWVENSHASTAVSYAHGLSTAMHQRGETDREVVAVIGDGALSYKAETIVEAFYSLQVTKGTWVTADYQRIANPAYNAARRVGSCSPLTWQALQSRVSARIARNMVSVLRPGMRSTVSAMAVLPMLSARSMTLRVMFQSLVE